MHQFTEQGNCNVDLIQNCCQKQEFIDIFYDNFGQSLVQDHINMTNICEQKIYQNNLEIYVQDQLQQAQKQKKRFLESIIQGKNMQKEYGNKSNLFQNQPGQQNSDILGSVQQIISDQQGKKQIFTSPINSTGLANTQLIRDQERQITKKQTKQNKKTLPRILYRFQGDHLILFQAPIKSSDVKSKLKEISPTNEKSNYQ